LDDLSPQKMHSRGGTRNHVNAAHQVPPLLSAGGCRG
jgi:hypothetical protein